MNKKKIGVIIIIILLIISILFFVSLFFNNDGKFNYESYFRLKAQYLNSSKKCDNLNTDDVNNLNKGFKNIGYSGGLNYWCNLKTIHFFDLDNFYKGKKLKEISIPKEIGKLKNLYEINLTKVIIKGDIPKEIGKLNNLVILELNGTGIEKLPKEIENLNKLKILFIGKHLYNSLAKSIKQKIKNNDIIDYFYYIEDYNN